jgi:Tol biopolymer transport system component
MKNLLKGAFLLICFGVSISLIQISCSKSDAQTNSNNNQNVVAQVNKILYTSQASGSYKIWTANYDGTNPTQINIALPAGVTIPFGHSNFSMYLSPDGQKIFFFADNPVSPGANSLYSCNIDGSNVLPVITSSSELLQLYGAY